VERMGDSCNEYQANEKSSSQSWCEHGVYDLIAVTVALPMFELNAITSGPFWRSPL
jgi:hypothetical protein